MTVFIDSSVWFAIANIKDRHRARAKEIIRDEVDRVTTDHVVVETWLLINSRINRAAAEAFWRGIRRGGATVEKVDPVDLDAAWSIGAAFPDQKFSIVDRSSFAVMERLGISRVASFDDDFVVYRFGRRRERAFDVLR